MNKLVEAVGEFDEATSPDIQGISGVYTPDGETMFRVRFRRAGGMNDDFNKAWEKITRTYRRGGVDMSTLAPKVQRNLTAPLYARHVLIGWEAEDFGTEFSVDAAEATLKKVPAFLDWLVSQATNQSNFVQRTRENDAGN